MRQRTPHWTRWPVYGPFLVFLALLGVFASLGAQFLFFPSAQANGPVTVSIQAPDLVLVDSDFVAPVTISQVVNFDAANYVVTFNPGVLAATNVTPGAIGGTEIPVGALNIDNASGRVTIVQNVPGLAGVSGTGSLAEVHFHVVGSAGETSPVDLEDGVLGDNAASAIPAVWVGDSVTITPHQVATVSIDAPDQVFVDSNFTALVRISDVTNFDAANYDVVFDPNVLRTADVSPGLIGGTVVPVDTWIEVEPGRIRIIQNIPGVDGTTGVGYLAGVSFLVVGGEGATGDIAMKDMVLGDTESRPIPSQTVGHTLSVIVPVDPLLCTSPFPPSFDFGELNRGELGQESFELTNCGTGTLDWTVSANQPWISLNPSQGTTTAETETVVVTADTSTLQGGQTHTSTITVSSNGGAVEGTISVTVIASGDALRPGGV